MSSSWLIPAAVAVVLPLVMRAVGKKNAVVVAPASGAVVMRLPKFFGILGWIGLLMTAGFVAAGVFLFGKGSIPTGVFLLAIGGLFGWMSVVLIRDGQHHRVAYDDASFQVTDGAGVTRTSEWSDVISGKVHPITKMIHLSTKDGQVLKINAYLIGSDAFFSSLAQRTGLPVADLVMRARYPG